MIKFPKKIKLWRVPCDPASFSDMDELRGKLARYAFQPIDDLPGEPTASGYVSVEDMDNGPDAGSIMFGDGYIIARRTDTRKIDKKAAKRLLEKKIRKEGGEWGKARKKEALEAIEAHLMSQAVPIPSVENIFLLPKEGVVYLPVNSEKKAEEMMDFLTQELGIERRNEPAEEIGEALDKLWLDAENNRGVGYSEFTPLAVKDEESTTTSDSSEDLMFGRLNNDKHLIACSLVLDSNNAKVEIKKNRDGLTIDLNIPKGEDEGLEDTIIMQCHETFEGVRKLLSQDTSETADGILEKFRQIAEARIQ